MLFPNHFGVYSVLTSSRVRWLVAAFHWRRAIARLASLQSCYHNMVQLWTSLVLPFLLSSQVRAPWQLFPETDMMLHHHHLRCHKEINRNIEILGRISIFKITPPKNHGTCLGQFFLFPTTPVVCRTWSSDLSSVRIDYRW